MCRATKIVPQIFAFVKREVAIYGDIGFLFSAFVVLLDIL